ncbi:penicillin acylase family protein [Nannocystis sp.]|uniref:penicillin acylase family protein n=1 Tax=Nannocystis sp. TaxID=1962667 RepID=UPI0025F1E528|nr:penicillin acylase family protein [Nannocystis sp.]
MVEQLLGVARATSVAELRESLATVQGVPWSYTLALDDQGDVFFGDISNVPAVPAALLSECPTALTPLLRPLGIHVLDGGRSACEWTGRLPAADLPALMRSDYVANSNNNHELPNLSAPLGGYSPILGDEDTALSLRASLGLAMIEERLEGSDGLGEPGFTGPLARDVFRLARNRGGELLADAIVTDCLAEPTGTWDGAEVDLTEICTTLAAWDRRNGVGSVGALVFAGLWASLADTGELASIFAMPADRDDPLGTPSGYSSSMNTRVAVRNALARVQLTLADLGIPATAPWGDVNAVLGPMGPRGVPGGQGSQGIFDVIESADGYGTWSGWTAALEGVAPPDLFGASYVHLVTFGPDGPEAEGLLAYSQATELDSPWYMDQLDAYSQGEWFTFPFTEAAIIADPNLTQIDL